MANRSNDLGPPIQRELVRCNACRAAIPESLQRCSYCGQLTTGTEQKVSALDITYERLERRSERRARYQCKVCGKAVAPKLEICSSCEASERNKTRLIIALAVLAVIAIFWFFG
jgi:predicted nucleic acid-binding Zn ribbon protein